MAAIMEPAPTPKGFAHAIIYGTMEATEADAHLVTEGICAAVRAGYRALDLAEHYESSRGGHIGEALDQLASEVPRSELWLTHKIDGMPVGDYAAVKARVQTMLELAHTDYLDALLIHFPLPGGADLSGDPSAISTAANFEWFVANIGEAWANMVKLKEDGLVLNIGVSNFYEQHLQELAKHTAEDGAECWANEVFIDAAHPQKDLVAYCHAQGMVVMAYRPTAFVMVYGLLDGVMDALQALAEERGLESVQSLVIEALCLRGIAPITGARTPEHMATNLKAAASKGDSASVIPAKGAPLPADLAPVEEQAEMVEMMGGLDEYAMAFARMGIDQGEA